MTHIQRVASIGSRLNLTDKCAVERRFVLTTTTTTTTTSGLQREREWSVGGRARRRGLCQRSSPPTDQPRACTGLAADNCAADTQAFDRSTASPPAAAAASIVGVIASNIYRRPRRRRRRLLGRYGRRVRDAASPDSRQSEDDQLKNRSNKISAVLSVEVAGGHAAPRRIRDIQSGACIVFESRQDRTHSRAY